MKWYCHRMKLRHYPAVFINSSSDYQNTLSCTFWVYVAIALFFSLDVPDNICGYEREELPTYWQDKTYERTQGWLISYVTTPKSGNRQVNIKPCALI